MDGTTVPAADPGLEPGAALLRARRLGHRPEAIPGGAGPGSQAASGAALRERIQRRIGLELEFPIVVDGQGILTPEVEGLLARPPDDPARLARQRGDLLDKDTTLFEGTGFKVSPDHRTGMLAPLIEATPAQAFWTNILEFIFKPAVETRQEMDTVLEAIYAKVAEIGVATQGLTERAPLNGRYFVGPMNTGGRKPDPLALEADSLQVNVGVEPQKITDFFQSFSRATELRGDGVGGRFRNALASAVDVATRLELEVRAEERAPGALLGLRGVFAVMALYLEVGLGGVAEGTVKNFTPLLLKTPLSNLTVRALNEEENALYQQNRQSYLDRVLAMVRGPDARRNDLLVTGRKGERTGVTVSGLIDEGFQAPFIAAGKGIGADPVGPQRDPQTDSSVRQGRGGNRRRGGIFESRLSGGRFDLDAAKARAGEMFERVHGLHELPDEATSQPGGLTPPALDLERRLEAEFGAVAPRLLERTREAARGAGEDEVRGTLEDLVVELETSVGRPSFPQRLAEARQVAPEAPAEVFRALNPRAQAAVGAHGVYQELLSAVEDLEWDLDAEEFQREDGRVRQLEGRIPEGFDSAFAGLLRRAETARDDHWLDVFAAGMVELAARVGDADSFAEKKRELTGVGRRISENGKVRLRERFEARWQAGLAARQTFEALSEAVENLEWDMDEDEFQQEDARVRDLEGRIPEGFAGAFAPLLRRAEAARLEHREQMVAEEVVRLEGLVQDDRGFRAGCARFSALFNALPVRSRDRILVRLEPRLEAALTAFEVFPLLRGAVEDLEWEVGEAAFAGEDGKVRALEGRIPATHRATFAALLLRAEAARRDHQQT